MVITTAQLHLTKPEIRFCAGSSPARDASEISYDEDLWEWFRLEIRLSTFCGSTILQNNWSSSSYFYEKNFLCFGKMELCYIFSKSVYLMFRELDLSCQKIKKLLTFFHKRAFLIFREMEIFKKTSYILGGHFPSTEKISYIFGNGTF